MTLKMGVSNPHFKKKETFLKDRPFLSRINLESTLSDPRVGIGKVKESMLTRHNATYSATPKLAGTKTPGKKTARDKGKRAAEILKELAGLKKQLSELLGQE